MMSQSRLQFGFLMSAFLAMASTRGRAETPSLVLVEDGQAKIQIWQSGEAKDAVDELSNYIRKMSMATLEAKLFKEEERPTAEAPGIAVGQLALALGLEAPLQTVSGDGYRIRRQGNRILIAGETPESTYFAACHFLETLGCRWFFDNELGEVVPQMRTIAVGDLDIAEKPDFISRSIWGPNWHAKTWKRRNRMGGLGMPTGHDWGYVPVDKYFKDHPEYYSLRGGERRAGNWLCTSNPEAQKIFGEALAAQVQGKGGVAVSISPPDGRGYCQCERCQALDDPAYLEPSSGSIAISDRYQHFYNAIGKEVLKANPQAILNFYAYADYSLPPKHVKESPENLCVWMAPIRFCRLHSMSSPICESRKRLRQVVEDWRKVVPRLGWREYNYNLAELTAPLSKISIWREDIPHLHKSGCLGLNIETLALWHIYGPHTYLIARMAWDADLDVDAVMDDFYSRFCGKAAAHVKNYWQRIDEAYRKTNVHAGCFYSLHAVWKPELVTACEADLNAAAQAAEDDMVRRRVEMFRMGLQNIQLYLALREAANRCDFAKAKQVYGEWLEHMDSVQAAKIHVIGEYKHGYAPRFLGKAIEQGAARVTGENKFLLQLPDEWDFRYDATDEGEAAKWHEAGTAQEGWRKAKTYSATLNEQGIAEELTWMWYRTGFQLAEVPAARRVFLWFAEVDGRSVKVFLNGELVLDERIKREPFEVEVTGKLRQGPNFLVVKVDHSSISELMLGGIIKPVMIYSSKAHK